MLQICLFSAGEAICPFSSTLLRTKGTSSTELDGLLARLASKIEATKHAPANKKS
jgi:hypothetical protein